MSIKVISNPSIQHLQEIEDWLIEEDNLFKKGFYCNISIIKQSFDTKNLIVITENKKAIGFLTYYFSHDLVVEISIAEIKQDKRKMGLGKVLLENSCNNFIKMGALVAQLKCSPVSSRKAWKRMGFMDFPAGIIRESGLYLYKILVETTSLYSGNGDVERIDLWDFDDHFNQIGPKWRWELKRKPDSNVLIKPIIQPAGDEWSVSHNLNRKLTEKTIMKYFNRKKHDCGYFMIIKEFDQQKQ
jgi:predicted GNAT family acetyltransferase